jgi:hypothetical protein
MDKITYQHSELKLSTEEIDEVLADDDTKDFSLEPSKRGNNRKMFVGPNQKAELCEVGVEFLPDDQGDFDWHIFHADNATRYWRNKFYKQRASKS